jgi:hypothetical protein
MPEYIKRSPRQTITSWVFFLTVTIAVGLASTYEMERVPPFWWDEGWTVNVARNWIEYNHYGYLLDGIPDPPSLSGAFPVVLPVALSFRFLGVGIWQARLPGVFITLGSLTLIFILTRYLYNQSIAIGSVLISLLMSGAQQLHPILVGRQVLGEMPAIFFLLAGYAFLILAINKSILWFVLTSIAWGLALSTKVQVMPFWLLSLLLPIALAMIWGKWKVVCIYILSGVGAWFLYQTFPMIQQIFLGPDFIPAQMVKGLMAITAIVPDLRVRKASLYTVLLYGLPALIGVIYSSSKFIQGVHSRQQHHDSELLLLSLLSLTGSWLAWYLFLGMFWTRYLFPPLFLGSVFASALLYELTDQFNFKKTIKNASNFIIKCKIERNTLGALLAIFLVAFTVPVTIRMLAYSYTQGADNSVMQVVDFLNHKTSQYALIETYDSELFFLLNRRYHYPPNYISVDAVQKVYLGSGEDLSYDPLLANPDVIVVGPTSKEWQIYDDVISTSAFRLVFDLPRYKIYERQP